MLNALAVPVYSTQLVIRVIQSLMALQSGWSCHLLAVLACSDNVMGFGVCHSSCHRPVCFQL